MITFDTPRAIYIQIADTIASYIVDGKWVEGERLPSVREMAATMGVNPATVLRAYDKLLSEDVIEMQRGVGYFLKTGAVDHIFTAQRAEFFKTTLPEIATTMTKLKISPAELLAFWKQP